MRTSPIRPGRIRWCRGRPRWWSTRTGDPAAPSQRQPALADPAPGDGDRRENRRDSRPRGRGGDGIEGRAHAHHRHLFQSQARDRVRRRRGVRQQFSICFACDVTGGAGPRPDRRVPRGRVLHAGPDRGPADAPLDPPPHHALPGGTQRAGDRLTIGARGWGGPDWRRATAHAAPQAAQSRDAGAPDAAGAGAGLRRRGGGAAGGYAGAGGEAAVRRAVDAAGGVHPQGPPRCAPRPRGGPCDDDARHAAPDERQGLRGAPDAAAAGDGRRAPEALVLRYLAAFGPATAADFQTWSGLRVRATFLWDGFVAGTWTVERKRDRAALRLAPFEPLPEAAAAELAEEGEALLRFLEADARSFAVEFGTHDSNWPRSGS